MSQTATCKHDTIGKTLDMCAASLSILCLLHCLLLPIAVAVLPLAAGLAEAEWLHKVLVLMAVPVSVIATARAWGMSYFPAFAALSSAGLLLLAGAAFIPAAESSETVITVIGATVLALSHIFRWHRHAKLAARL